MKKRAFGKTGEMVSRMALGTMYFNTQVSAEKSIAQMDAYVAAGGNFIDTANMYAAWLEGFIGGESENLIGQWMKDRGNRKQIFLSTKVGLPMKDVPQSLKGSLVLRECENSLKRLQTDWIDLYFIHHEDPDTPIEETLEALDKLVKQGKVRYVGVSNHCTWRVVEANQVARMKGLVELCCAQYKYTYVRPRHETSFDPQMGASEDMLSYCQEKGMAFMAYSPLMGGSYVNPAIPLWNQYLCADTDARLKAVRRMAQETGISVNHLVLAWLMQSKNQVIPLITGENVDHILENIAADQVVLTPEQVEALSAVSA